MDERFLCDLEIIRKDSISASTVLNVFSFFRMNKNNKSIATIQNRIRSIFICSPPLAGRRNVPDDPAPALHHPVLLVVGDAGRSS